MQYRAMELGDAGVLAPGRWRWLRALGWLAALIAMAVACAATSGAIGRATGATPAVRAALGVGSLALIYALYVVLVRKFERRSVSELAPGALLPDLGTGLLIGAGMFTLVFTALRLLGTYSLTRGVWFDWPRDALTMTAVGFSEELVARAIIFRLLTRAFGVWPALIGSSLLFGAAHLGNQNATWLGAAAIAVEAGTMLAGFYILTGRLWMSIGVHIAWNFMQGPFFGARVSGHPEVGSLFTSAPLPTAPEWLAGGIFGPEASLPAIVVGLGTFLVTWQGARRRGVIVTTR